jgi:hypothetical protein
MIPRKSRKAQTGMSAGMKIVISLAIIVLMILLGIMIYKKGVLGILG